MIRNILKPILAGLLLCSCAIESQSQPEEPMCPPPNGVALQVLGSGGPIADDARASSAYLVWVDGRARVLIDAGSGAFLRLGETGGRFEDLDLIALSHFHTDHSADLPALLKSGNFSSRERALVVSGPASNRRFPGLSEFLDGFLNPDTGSYRYLSGYLDGSDGLVRLDTREMDHREKAPQIVIEKEGLIVTALGVPHGIVPALAYRVEAGEKSIVFGSDQNGSLDAFIDFTREADLLVAHMAIPENAGKSARSLHAPPSILGRIASEASVSGLLLSHFMARSLNSMDHNLEMISANFSGTTILAKDRLCLIP
jgi:ribonuclease BN (tRNA processing enzyme)